MWLEGMSLKGLAETILEELKAGGRYHEAVNREDDGSRKLLLALTGRLSPIEGSM